MGAYSGAFPLGYGLPLGYSDGFGNDHTYQQEADAQQPAPPPPAESPSNYDAQQPPAAAPPSEYRPVYRPEYQPENRGSAPIAPVKAQPATTLVFNDGRPEEQVHNYALTSTTLYDLDGERRREIPLSLLNVPATVTVNRSAGVDFALPVSR